MGYTTKFEGQLKFTRELKGSEIEKISSFFGEDLRDHPEWDGEGSYIDLRMTEDYSGIEWDDETEKNYGMVSHINLIIDEMRKTVPDFGLYGEMTVQGEYMRDRWKIKIIDGHAVKVEAEKANTIECPECGHHFIITKIID